MHLGCSFGMLNWACLSTEQNGKEIEWADQEKELQKKRKTCIWNEVAYVETVHGDCLC